MPRTMPKNPNWRRKKFDPVVAPRILPLNSDEELKKLEARRAAQAAVKSRQAARNQLIGEAVKKLGDLPRRQLLRELAKALPHIPAHVLSAVTAPAVPSGRAQG